MKPLHVLTVCLFVFGCGPTSRNHGGGDDGSGVDAFGTMCIPGSPEVCDDGIDNDCDGKVDCSDPDCSGVGTCPVCGNVNAPDATPIPLPDGISSGNTCTTDALCPAATPNCIIAPNTDVGVLKECHASYTSSLNFIGFPAGATLTDTTKLLQVCIEIEHSYLHDLQIELLSPPDASNLRKKVTLNEFVGRVGPEIFVGIPNENDETGPVIPGTPWKYCFDPTASVTMFNATMIQDQQAQDAPVDQVPAGNYLPMNPFSGLAGAPLNGEWEMRVTDLFSIDNGTLSGWSISFAPDLVSDCGGPIVQ
jgi:hypothetical protein